MGSDETQSAAFDTARRDSRSVDTHFRKRRWASCWRARGARRRRKKHPPARPRAVQRRQCRAARPPRASSAASDEGGAAGGQQKVTASTVSFVG
eukprot:6212517-Pleurochrysis_carterae.AAC.3